MQRYPSIEDDISRAISVSLSIPFSAIETTVTKPRDSMDVQVKLRLGPDDSVSEEQRIVVGDTVSAQTVIDMFVFSLRKCVEAHLKQQAQQTAYDSLVKLIQTKLTNNQASMINAVTHCRYADAHTLTVERNTLNCILAAMIDDTK